MELSSIQIEKEKKNHYKNDLTYQLAVLRENNNIDSVLPSISIPWLAKIDPKPKQHNKLGKLTKVRYFLRKGFQVLRLSVEMVKQTY